MIIAATGHRPKDITENFDTVVLKARVKMQDKATRLICGMAEGFDLLAAKAAMELNIPITVARPWNTHTVGGDWISLYNKVLEYADMIHVVTNSNTYHVSYLHKRNHWMVDHCDAVMAYWNGKENGGTYECLKYAQKHDPLPLIANIYDDPPF